VFVFFLALGMSLNAQIPDPTGETQWDYCECVEGIQQFDDLCPCPQTFPPSGSGGTGSSGSGGTSSTEPTGTGTSGTGGTGGTSWTEFWTMLMETFCEQYPDLCD